jgi:L-alanine-DL-glutamate epimerase-like enolase superfamily enzyme
MQPLSNSVKQMPGRHGGKLHIEAINRDLIGYLGWRGAGVEMRGNSAIDIALWA